MLYAWRTAENSPPQLIIPTIRPTDSHQQCDIVKNFN